LKKPTLKTFLKLYLEEKYTRFDYRSLVSSEALTCKTTGANSLWVKGFSPYNIYDSFYSKECKSPIFTFTEVARPGVTTVTVLPVKRFYNYFLYGSACVKIVTVLPVKRFYNYFLYGAGFPSLPPALARAATDRQRTAGTRISYALAWIRKFGDFDKH
jgi:hypothetical protein